MAKAHWALAMGTGNVGKAIGTVKKHSKECTVLYSKYFEE